MGSQPGVYMTLEEKENEDGQNDDGPGKGEFRFVDPTADELEDPSDREPHKTLADELEDRIDDTLQGEVASAEDVKEAFRS